MAGDKEATLLLRIKQTGAETIDKLGSGLKMLGGIATAVFGGLVALGTAAVKSYADQEKATNSLNQSLVQQGIYTKQLSNEYQSLAGELQKKSAFADEEIVQAQAIMQGYLGQTKISKELLKATLDLAAAKGMDLSSAAELVAKSIGTSTNALARQGIKLKEGATTTEKLAEVTKQLTQKMGGQSEAAIRGLGAFTVLKNSVGEVLEALGQRLQPVVVLVINGLTKMADQLQNNKGFLEGVASAIKFASQTGVVLYSVLQTIGTVIGSVLGTAFGALGQAIEGNFKMAFMTVKDGSVALGSDLSDTWTNTYANLDALDKAFLAKKQENINTEHEMLKQSEVNKAAILAEAQVLKDEAFVFKSEEELVKLQAHEDIKTNVELTAELTRLNNKITSAATMTEKLKAEQEKRKFMEEQYEKQRQKTMDMADKFDEFMSQKKIARATDTLNYLTRMQDSKSKELVAIGKAAAIANITIDTARAVMGVWSWAAQIPFVGPVIAGALTAAIVGYGAEQIGRVTSAQMAEGGIVKARPGGMLATIGEGGKDEMVIPLDDERAGGLMGSNVTIVVNGGMLGDASSAREFAVAVDKELLRLRQSNESVAFDKGII